MDELVALAERLQARCGAIGARVATAESCTGGMIAAAITSVPGSSGHFVGGIVAYSDALKRALLGVDDALLASHGAVSAQVAVAMARGARARTGAELAVAVTGISGPGGGTVDKPVGLTYVAVASQAGDVVRRFSWHGDREENRVASAQAALELLLEAAALPAAG